MFIVTSRLTLRPPWPEDADALFAAIAYPSVVRELSHRIPWPYRRDDACAFIAAESAFATPRALIFRHEPDAPFPLIGGIGLHKEDGQVMLGYWLSPAYWGQGYLLESAHAVLACARDGLRHSRIGATHFADNVRSARVLARLGFIRTEAVTLTGNALRDAADCAGYRMVLQFG